MVLLGPRLAAVQVDDVAELAVERTAAGELHRHHQVGLTLQKVVAGYGAVGDIRFLRGPEHPAGCTPFEGRQEGGNGDLALIQDQIVGT